MPESILDTYRRGLHESTTGESVMDTFRRGSGQSVADQARASMERRKQGGDIPLMGEPRGFWEGVKDAVIPSREGAEQLARSLVAPFAPTPDNLRAIGSTGRNIGSAQVGQVRAAYDTSRGALEDLRHGDVGGAAGKYLETAGHTTAALLPVLGPAAANAGEDIKRGDIAYGLGKGIGTAATVAVPAAAGDVVRTAAPAVARGLRASAQATMARGAATAPELPAGVVDVNKAMAARDLPDVVSTPPEATGRAALRRILDEDQYDTYGVRVLTRQYKDDILPDLKVGDTAPPSRRWVDDAVTDEMEDGASAIDARHPQAMKYARQYGDPSDQAVILGTNRATATGVDPGEIVMREPKVLWVGTRADLTGEGAIPVRSRPPTAQAVPAEPADTFRANLQRIAAVNPDAPTLTTVLKTAGHEAKGAGVVGLISEFPGVAHIPYMKELLMATGTIKGAMAAYKALRDLPKTSVFKAASVTTKVAFAKALQGGDLANAVRIGGEIAGGAAVESTDQSPRQTVTGGSPLSTPSAGTTALAESDSKDRLRERGKGTEFPLRKTTPVHPQSGYTRWDTTPHENEWLFDIRPGQPFHPSLLLPERFQYARKAVLMNARKLDASVIPGIPDEGYASGVFGQPVTPEQKADLQRFRQLHDWRKAGRLFDSGRDNDPDYNTIITAPSREGMDRRLIGPDESLPADEQDPDSAYAKASINELIDPQVLMHEYGHAAFRGGDVPEKLKEEWWDHVDHLQDLALADPTFPRPHFSINGGEKPRPLSAWKRPDWMPQAVLAYWGDPDHAFAELFASYVMDPSEFKAAHPWEYGFMRRVFGGREYIRPPKSSGRQ